MFIIPKLTFDCAHLFCKNSAFLSNYPFYSIDNGSREQSPQRNNHEINGVTDADGLLPEMSARLESGLSYVCI
jgi:hypothetical protein